MKNRKLWPRWLLARRFWAKVQKAAGDGCWLWTGPTFNKNGVPWYGCFFDGQRNRQTHRVAFELEIGEIPRGAVIRHRCNVGLCIRPSHLIAGTHEDNTADRLERIRAGVPMSQVEASSKQGSLAFAQEGR